MSIIYPYEANSGKGVRAYRSGREGALRRPRRVQRRNLRATKHVNNSLRPLLRGQGHRSALSLLGERCHSLMVRDLFSPEKFQF